MSTAVQGLLATFERLTTEERQEAFVELLRRTRALEYPPMDDETIDQIPDDSFLQYDGREVEAAVHNPPGL